jgi:Na+-driven multidrug efflux pump
MVGRLPMTVSALPNPDDVPQGRGLLDFLFHAYCMVVTQAFNSAGDTWTPTVVNLFVFWLWEIPLAWWLSSRAGFGARGVFMALTMADSTLAVVSAILFRRGSWKKTAV